MKHLFILISLMLGYACSTDSNCQDEELELIGRWELVEFCYSPGDDSCPPQTPKQEQIIEFRTDSTFIFSIGDSSTVGSFTVSNRFIDFIDDQGETTDSRFISENTSCGLELSPLCIEVCRELYVKR